MHDITLIAILLILGFIDLLQQYRIKSLQEQIDALVEEE